MPIQCRGCKTISTTTLWFLLLPVWGGLSVPVLHLLKAGTEVHKSASQCLSSPREDMSLCPCPAALREGPGSDSLSPTAEQVWPENPGGSLGSSPAPHQWGTWWKEAQRHLELITSAFRASGSQTLKATQSGGWETLGTGQPSAPEPPRGRAAVWLCPLPRSCTLSSASTHSFARNQLLSCESHVLASTGPVRPNTVSFRLFGS